MQVLKLYFSPVAITLILFLYNSTIAQTIPDSFVNKLNHAINDSAKGITLLEIGESIVEIMQKQAST
jgi:hypothetical protein